MCGGFVGKVLSPITDALGLTDVKGASKGFDAAAAEKKAQAEAQQSANASIAERKKRSASTVLSSATDTQKKTTLGG